MNRRSFFKGLSAGIAGVFALPHIFVPVFEKGIWKAKTIVSKKFVGYVIDPDVLLLSPGGIYKATTPGLWVPVHGDGKPLAVGLDYGNAERPWNYQTRFNKCNDRGERIEKIVPCWDDEPITTT